ncbi:MAG: hypothetical protein EXS37_00085 [Opitutus sp.]|nr:hypothetical protein [Opitutus sp.]
MINHLRSCGLTLALLATAFTSAFAAPRVFTVGDSTMANKPPDLTVATAKWLQVVGDEPSRKFFMWIEPGVHPKIPDGRKDDTHFVEAGATHVARLAVDGMRELKLPLTQWLN